VWSDPEFLKDDSSILGPDLRWSKPLEESGDEPKIAAWPMPKAERKEKEL